MPIPATPSSLTFTAPIGAGFSAIAAKITGKVRKLTFNFDTATLDVLDDTPNIKSIAIDGLTTITATIAADVATVTVS